MSYLPPVTPFNPADPRAGENMLRNLIANLDGMVYRCRIDDDWTMEFLSHGCPILTGYQVDDLLYNAAVTYQQVTHPEDRVRVTETIMAALAIDQPFSFEYRIVRQDGVVRWVWERGIGARGDDGRYIAIEGLIQDVTHRKEAELALYEAEQRFRSIFENSVEGMFQSRLDGRYIAANPALARILGFDSPADMIQATNQQGWNVYADPARRQHLLDEIARVGFVTNFESQVQRRDGTLIYLTENIRAVRYQNDQLDCLEGSVVDITERKSFEEKIRFQATHDALTGLPNRNLLHDRITTAIQTARRDETTAAVVFVDLDRFKLINDSLGHQIGDVLLKVIAQRLSASIRGTDTVARQGGDEFVVLLPHQSSFEMTTVIVERMLHAVSQPLEIEGVALEVTCSIGISLYPNDGESADELLRCADSAMYNAKQFGRNSFKYFSAEMNAHAAERLHLLNGLRSAIHHDEFILHYQPKIDLATGSLIGAEALIRWESKTRGLVSPAEFIPFAEENGLINPIGEWVLRAACTQAVTWQQAGYAPLVISVNLSANQLSKDDLVATVANVLASTGLDAKWLELEITETAVMGDVDKSMSMLHQLKKLGVQISIDDFGTGYSSLYYLKLFPVDTLKIDRSFISEIVTEGEDAAIVKAIIALAHILHLNVVAEGVETEQQRLLLLDYSCDQGQGYFFSRPVINIKFETLLTRLSPPDEAFDFHNQSAA